MEINWLREFRFGASTKRRLRAKMREELHQRTAARFDELLEEHVRKLAPVVAKEERAKDFNAGFQRACEQIYGLTNLPMGDGGYRGFSFNGAQAHPDADGRMTFDPNE